MLCDALRLLRMLRPVEDYQYVGLGHWQFVDFELMRREVGIRSMVSIERNTAQKARFEENKPFAEIDLLFGDAFDRLQDIDLDRPTVAWLDYTSKLDAAALGDLRYLAGKLPPGSVLACTVNCHPDREDERLDALRRLLGDEIVPGDVAEADLDRVGLPRVQRRILMEQVGAAAAVRIPSGTLQQFMLLRYADRAPMLFWAALLVDESIAEAVDRVPFARLEQCSDGEEPLEISVPWLSTREVIALNEQIRAGTVPNVPGLKKQECEAYARLHRWYPPVPLPF
jgi:hypothetical protein